MRFRLFDQTLQKVFDAPTYHDILDAFNLTVRLGHDCVLFNLTMTAPFNVVMYSTAGSVYGPKETA